MAKNPNGFDPVDVYMNGTLNVVTGFSLGIIYKFNDPDFVKLADGVKTFFKYLQLVYVTKFIRMSLPSFILRLQTNYYIFRVFLSPLFWLLRPFMESLFEG